MKSISIKEFLSGDLGCLKNDLKNVEQLKMLVTNAISVIDNVDICNSEIEYDDNVFLNADKIISVVFEFNELVVNDGTKISAFADLFDHVYAAGIGYSSKNVDGMEIYVNVGGFIKEV